jgi:hypothetical protein
VRTYKETLEETRTVLIKNFISPDKAREWAQRAKDGVETRVDREGSEAKNLDEGGAYNHGIANALSSYKILPEIFGIYESLPSYLSELTGRQVITSPYEKSTVTLKIYDKPNDQQGWHKDTNAFTALLILTDTGPGYGTEIEGIDGNVFNLENEAGDLWLMYGRELRHRVPPIPEGKWRVTVPMNYYFSDDTWRPEGMDDLVYGM